MADDYEHVEFPDAEAFEAWLSENGAASPGVRLRIAKKSSPVATVTYSEALDVALCHGWIDGRRNGLDDDYFLQTFTPRRARSKWSQVNRERVAALEAAGRIRDAGRSEIDRAKGDGRWEAAYASPKTIEVPPDFAEALAAVPAAADRFAALSSQARYSILFTLHHLKRPETRTRRIASYVADLSAEPPG